MPGRDPLVHEAPLFVGVAKPLSEAPPSKKRPCWATATIVEPAEKVSGSTTVWCWLLEFVKGSLRMRLLPFADAPADTTSAAVAARVGMRILGFMCVLASKSERPACAGLCCRGVREGLLVRQVERRSSV